MDTALAKHEFSEILKAPSARRKYFVTDHIGTIRTTADIDGNVLGYDDYYPFGLTMPGRSSNSSNPNDN
jgi:hypothetical protein